MKHCEMGTYAHSIPTITPEGKLVDIDRCIHKEILDLWAKGIKTGGCCCGHGYLVAMVNVYEEDMQKMTDMDYIGGFNRYGTPTYALKTQVGTMEGTDE